MWRVLVRAACVVVGAESTRWNYLGKAPAHPNYTNESAQINAATAGCTHRFRNILLPHSSHSSTHAIAAKGFIQSRRPLACPPGCPAAEASLAAAATAAATHTTFYSHPTQHGTHEDEIERYLLILGHPHI